MPTKKKKLVAPQLPAGRPSNSILVMLMLTLIDSDRAMTQSRIKDKLNVSIPTVARLLRLARETYRVEIEWTGEGFAITDWGVFTGPERLRQWSNAVLRQLNSVSRRT